MAAVSSGHKLLEQLKIGLVVVDFDVFVSRYVLLDYGQLKRRDFDAISRQEALGVVELVKRLQEERLPFLCEVLGIEVGQLWREHLELWFDLGAEALARVGITGENWRDVGMRKPSGFVLRTGELFDSLAYDFGFLLQPVLHRLNPKIEWMAHKGPKRYLSHNKPVIALPEHRESSFSINPVDLFEVTEIHSLYAEDPREYRYHRLDQSTQNEFSLVIPDTMPD